MRSGALRTRPAMSFARFVRPTILDRYIIAELIGPFTFGLSAFTLIFAATLILATSRLVAEEHAPLGAAVAYFLWQMPQVIVTTMPMAMLLGTLLALQRLSGESELTALKAGGIGLVRAVAPVLIMGVVVSLASLVIQETLVPYANDQAAYLRDDTIKHVGAFGGSSRYVVSQLPGGGQQVTYFRGYDAAKEELLYVTIITYGRDKRPSLIVISDRGHFEAPSWTFLNARQYRFAEDGSTDFSSEPELRVDVGEKPSEIQQRVTDNNRETMSRSQIKEIIASGQLSPHDVRAYQTTYEEKLARPFASFVFTLIAIPFGIRPTRGGGGAGLGFGLAVAIIFVYFVVSSVFSAVVTGLPGGFVVSTIGAWAANVIFTTIGALTLRRTARY